MIYMNRINLTDSEMAALAARIQRNYDYHDGSGLLINKRTGRVVRGTTRNKQNYRSFDFQYDGIVKHLNYHWAVWAWHHGCFPTMQIDHVNGNKRDNHIENLREVSDSDNMMNQLHPWRPNNVTGVPGVSPNGRQYQTKLHGKSYRFHNPYEAFYHATMCGKRYK